MSACTTPSGRPLRLTDGADRVTIESRSETIWGGMKKGDLEIAGKGIYGKPNGVLHMQY